MTPEQIEALEYGESKQELLGLHSAHVMLWTLTDALREMQTRMNELETFISDVGPTNIRKTCLELIDKNKALRGALEYAERNCCDHLLSCTLGHHSQDCIASKAKQALAAGGGE